MTDFDTVYERFQYCARMDARLLMTSDQKALVAKERFGGEVSGDELPDVKTAFFDFGDLEDDHVDSLDEYVFLGNEELGDQLDAGTLVPFAALNQSGSSLDHGADIFAENNNWGALCFDLANGKGKDCPVVWAFKGKLYPWAPAASGLEVEVIESDDD